MVRRDLWLSWAGSAGKFFAKTLIEHRGHPKVPSQTLRTTNQHSAIHDSDLRGCRESRCYSSVTTVVQCSTRHYSCKPRARLSHLGSILRPEEHITPRRAYYAPKNILQ